MCLLQPSRNSFNRSANQDGEQIVKNVPKMGAVVACGDLNFPGVHWSSQTYNFVDEQIVI